MFVVIFLLELLFLYLLSRSLTKEISFLIHKIFKHKQITVYLLAILFLPGTIFHELSHQIMAELLFVRTGKIHLIPEIVGSEIKMGTAEIAKTDPFRRFLIGAAPFIFGVSIILLMIYISIKNSLYKNNWAVLGTAYFIFQITNTMFSSKKDMEGSAYVILFTILILAVTYFTGFRIPFDQILNNSLTIQIFKQASIYFLLPILFDLLIVIALQIIRSYS